MISITKNKSILLKNIALKIVLPIIFIITAWEVIYLVTANSYFVPSIPDTMISLFGIVTDISFFKIVLTSLLRVLAGLLLGVISGIGLATLCQYSFIARCILSPIISIMKATPVACMIVLLWISMTYNQLTVFVVLLMVLPIVWQNSMDAYRSIDRELVEVADVFEVSRIKRFKLLIFPALLNYLIPATVTSVGLAWKAEVAAEIMTNSNMGRLIYDYKNISFDTASVFAWTIIIVVISMLFENTAKYFLGRLRNVATH